ncbi:MAG: endonuclease domain-containing protein [Janthinobacterium lividum]
MDREGVIARAAHPELAGAVGRLVRSGELLAVMPGVYAMRGRAQERSIRVLALATRQPDAVLVARTAAQLTYWPGLPGNAVSYALDHKCLRQPGFQGSQRLVPPELVLQRKQLRMTVPGLTALDLVAELGGEGIDRALRTRTATLAGMHRAFELSGGRPGNRDRRLMLLDSRDEPWSEAERLSHRLLRGAGITGWKTNWPVKIEGNQYYLDVAFPRLRLVVEIDGRLHETEEDLFESDRWRQNALVLDGWLVLRFTWRMLTERPEKVLATIRRALAINGAHS